jgi:hypothetical protein
MAKSERWYHGVWERIYGINPALLGGCRGVSLLQPVKTAGFKQTSREFVSQSAFPSEIIFGVAS